MKKITLKRITLTLTLIISQPAHPCGEYRTIAKVTMREGAPSMIVYPDSKSEIFLKANPIESTKLAPYLNRYIMADLLILKKNDKTHYFIEEIRTINPVFPQMLSSKRGTQLVQIKKEVCKSTNELSH